MSSHSYGEGKVSSIKHTIHIGVPAADFYPLKHLGALPRISPCEYVMAALRSCSDATTGGAVDNVLKCWRKAFCSTVFVFKVVAPEMIRFSAMNLRGKEISDAASVTWTALQKVQVVINEAQLMANPTSPKGCSSVR